jgi:hypothetical protein
MIPSLAATRPQSEPRRVGTRSRRRAWHRWEYADDGTFEKIATTTRLTTICSHAATIAGSVRLRGSGFDERPRR